MKGGGVFTSERAECSFSPATLEEAFTLLWKKVEERVTLRGNNDQAISEDVVTRNSKENKNREGAKGNNKSTSTSKRKRGTSANRAK